MMDQPSEPVEENFAAMLEAFSPGKRAEVRIGDRVKGRIISIGKESVFVDTGMKIDAVVERGELLDADQNLTVAEGDELELYVAAVGEGEIRLSRAISGEGGAQALREAYQKKVPVEGKVKEPCKGASMWRSCSTGPSARRARSTSSPRRTLRSTWGRPTSS